MKPFYNGVDLSNGIQIYPLARLSAWVPRMQINCHQMSSQPTKHRSDEDYKAGAAAWPLLVPINQGDPGAAEMKMARKRLSQWQKPVLVMFSDSDPITHGGDIFFRRLIRIAREQPKIVIEDAGHFLQEEKGDEIAKHIVNFMHRTPTDLD